MIILEAHEINHLEDILSFIEGNELWNDEAEWLRGLLKEQPISLLQAQLAQIRADYEVLASDHFTLQRDYELASAGVESLKHLQKYEGMQKHESELIGLQQENRLLREEIERLRRG